MSEIIDHAHVQILSPAPTGPGGLAIQDSIVALADYDLNLAAQIALKAPTTHQHASADISDATHLPTPNTIAKRDAEGDLIVNRLDVASIYWGDETIVIDGQTIYAPTVSVTASQFIGSGQFLTDLPVHTHSISDITSLQTALDAKAAATHTHAITDTTGLQTALDGKQAAGSYANEVHAHSISDITSLQTALDGKAALAGATFTGAVTLPSLNVASNTASAPAVVYLRTSTHDTANSIYSITWRNDLDNADVGIVKLANPSVNSFTMTLGTYQHLATISMSNGDVTLENDLIGNGFWDIKGNASGTGRIDFRADTINCYAQFNPQNSMFMGWSGGNVSFNFGWTGKTGGNYRSIYAHYDNTDLIFLSQWADGSWDHECARLNDHGMLTIPDLIRASGLQVGEYVVVGARQPSIDDASEDLASVKTQLNLALAALRAHGLIQTPA